MIRPVRRILFGRIFFLALGTLMLSLSSAPAAARQQSSTSKDDVTTSASYPAPLPTGAADVGDNQSGVPIITGYSSRNDTSPRLSDIPAVPVQPQEEHEANLNPSVTTTHVGGPDPVVQRILGPLAMPPGLNFEGISFPGVSCNCAPPDPNGEVGAT